MSIGAKEGSNQGSHEGSHLLPAWAWGLILLLVFGGGVVRQEASAQATNRDSIVGVWITHDDNTQEPRAHIKISLDHGVLSGRIVKTLDPDALPGERCTKCSGDRKNQALVGLEIVRGGAQKNEKEGLWEGGRILDPETGEEYRLKIRLIDQGRTLQVRGYLGPFWRTQMWTRSETLDTTQPPQMHSPKEKS